ncbi:3-ketoacyl-CoA synthase [Forsythia ovata]|uniref:3-ketoacyl-CoA synthase n=1 Tax=Forsythia ovata TaxID=205694 RepID=A0ABD1VIP3_9LAMI
MAPTAAMLILGHHTRPTSRISNCSSSPSAPVFQVQASIAKYVSRFNTVFRQESSKVKESAAVDSSAAALERRFQEVIEMFIVDENRSTHMYTKGLILGKAIKERYSSYEFIFQDMK